MAVHGSARSGRRPLARRAAVLVVLVVLPTTGGFACRRAEAPSHLPAVAGQTRVASGDAHVDAVLPGAKFDVPRGGARLRAIVAGCGEGPRRCTFTGPAGRTVELASPGSTPAASAGTDADGNRPLDEPLAGGRWQLTGPVGARLEEPRLVTSEGRVGAGRTVVLVVVDTLRNDHLSQELMPRTIGALAGARRFVDTTANASWTLPSMASLLTSRPVLELAGPDGTLIGIPSGTTSLARHLRQVGFATAAFVANATLRESNGFGHGFARFVAPPVAAQPPDASAVLADARRWLTAHRGEDAFLWVHLMEPHEPLRDHQGRGRVPVAAAILAGRERSPTAEEEATFRTLYAEEVAYLDTVLAPFLAELPADAVVALTADHGEMLGEGTAWGHGLTVYPPVLQVPLLLRAPGLAPGEDLRPAELLDVVPTLLARLGVGPVGGDATGQPPTPPSNRGGGGTGEPGRKPTDQPADQPAGPRAGGPTGGPAGEVGLAFAGHDLAGPPAPDRERLAATYSPGVLRWAWRRGDRAVLAHFAAQPAAELGREDRVLERQPLPFGVWAHDPYGDPTAAAGVPPSGPLLAAAARAFAGDLGRLVRGLQILAVDWPANTPARLTVEGETRLIEVFATSPITLRQRGSAVELTWATAQPLALAVLGQLRRVQPVGSWAVGRRAPPELAVPGLSLWRNLRDPVEQREQSEIVDSLRALGYLQ